ncbi:MAG: glycosyl hydrolase family 43, partial [Prevotella sp.]|nr:glycosyl hydrolase family 43 [Prevotella sp.]
FCPEGTLTWNSQTTFVLTLPDGTPMYMGDRWSYPHQASAATYVWLPLQTEGTKLSIPTYWNAWDVRTIQPVDLSKNGVMKSVNFSSNTIGAKTVVPFKGKRIIVTGESNPHGGYAKLTIRKQDGSACTTALLDFYAKTPEQGIRYVSPILPKDNYELEIEVTGYRSNWTDKRHNHFGTDDCYVKVSSVYYD